MPFLGPNCRVQPDSVILCFAKWVFNNMSGGEWIIGYYGLPISVGYCVSQGVKDRVKLYVTRDASFYGFLFVAQVVYLTSYNCTVTRCSRIYCFARFIYIYKGRAQ